MRHYVVYCLLNILTHYIRISSASRTSRRITRRDVRERYLIRRTVGLAIGYVVFTIPLVRGCVCTSALPVPIPLDPMCSPPPLVRPNVHLLVWLHIYTSSAFVFRELHCLHAAPCSYRLTGAHVSDSGLHECRSSTMKTRDEFQDSR